MRRTILIADDEVPNRIALGEAFERRGYRVHLAADGREAVEIARSEPVTMGIFDYMMPRLGGVGALNELRRLSIQLPVVITTSMRDERIRDEALECGARGFFWKPLDLATIRDCVKSLIGEETTLAVRAPTSISITVLAKR